MLLVMIMKTAMAMTTTMTTVVVVGTMTITATTTTKLNAIFLDWIQLLFGLNTAMTIFHYDTLCLFLPHALTAGRAIFYK
jgi:hypothetical protein